MLLCKSEGDPTNISAEFSKIGSSIFYKKHTSQSPYYIVFILKSMKLDIHFFLLKKQTLATLRDT